MPLLLIRLTLPAIVWLVSAEKMFFEVSTSCTASTLMPLMKLKFWYSDMPANSASGTASTASTVMVNPRGARPLMERVPATVGQRGARAQSQDAGDVAIDHRQLGDLVLVERDVLLGVHPCSSAALRTSPVTVSAVAPSSKP